MAHGPLERASIAGGATRTAGAHAANRDAAESLVHAPPVNRLEGAGTTNSLANLAVFAPVDQHY